MSWLRTVHKVIYAILLVLLLAVFALLFLDMYKQYGVTLVMATNEPVSVEVYEADGLDFNNKSIQRNVNEIDTIQKVHLSLKDSLQYIRIDFGRGGADIHLKKIIVHNGLRSYKLNPAQIVKKFDFNRMVEHKFLDSGLLLTTSPNDPFIILKDPLAPVDVKTLPHILSSLLMITFGATFFAGLINMIGTTRSIKNYVALLLTLVVFVPFLWLQLTDGRKVASIDEKRKLANQPTFQNYKTTLYQYIKDYNQYFLDHFGLRNVLIKSYNAFQYYILNSSAQPERAITGKKGWLFYTYDHALNAYTNKELLEKGELEAIAEEIKKFHVWLNKRNIPFYVMVVPVKPNIYPEYLPGDVIRYREKSIHDQLVNYISRHTDIHLVEVKQTLLSKKKNFPLYYKRDTHWNAYGAFFAYQKLMRAIREDLPSIPPPYSLDDYKIEKDQWHKDDLMQVLSLSPYSKEYSFIPKFSYKLKAHKIDTFQNKNYTYIQRRVMEDSTLPKLLTLNDSYFANMYGFTKNHFSETVHVQPTFNLFPMKVLDREKPDIVVFEIAEKFIHRIDDK